MRFITNIHRAQNAIVPLIGQSLEDAESSIKQWLSGKIIGDPQGGHEHTVKDLRWMGLVGLYESEPIEGDVMTSDEIADYAAAEFVKSCDRRKED